MPARILIVDDQENWRSVLRSLFTDCGYEVDTAKSASDAWKLLEINAYNVAILDVRLVDSNPYDIQGIELLEKMKKRIEDHFPVVIMTGYSFEGLEEILRKRYGVQVFINKGEPILHDIKAFKALISSVMQNTELDDQPLSSCT